MPLPNDPLGTSKPFDDGGPAFPVPIAAIRNADGEACVYNAVNECGAGGMSLRDWFAGQALQAALLDPETSYYPEIAIDCYAAADAMIAARKAGGAA